MNTIPERLSFLHAGEEELRAKSIAFIEASEDMSLHISMIERCMDMHQYVHRNIPDMSEDQETVALIGASVFNSMASAIKLMLGGYYQASGLQIRYIMESGWLLDYLITDPELVQEWKITPEDKRQSVFRPGKIRDKLDKLYGFKEKKREARYKRLCVLSGHPSVAGSNMLRPEMNAGAEMGPFLVPDLLEGCIGELVQVSITATTSLMCFFPVKTPSDFRAKDHFRKTTEDWMEKVFGIRPDPTPVNELKKFLAYWEGY